MSATDEVSTPVVVGVLGTLGLAAVFILGEKAPATLPPQTATAASNGCPSGHERTPRYDVKVRTQPSETAPFLLNQKATDILGQTHYHQVDSSTAVSLKSCIEGWAKVAVTAPEWLRNVTGWVPSDAVLRPSELSAAQDAKPSFGQFSWEVARTTEALSCHAPKVTPAQFGEGALYGCIQGQAETAKYWINEDGAIPGQVENIKVMWNDWTDDRGWGVHSDKAEAEHMVRAAARLYAPELEQELVSAYFDHSPGSWKSKNIDIQYRWTPGAAINEHLLTMRPD